MVDPNDPESLDESSGDVTGADDAGETDEEGLFGLEDGEEATEEDIAAAAGAVELVVLPIACVDEGKGAPLAMGIQRWWAQELAGRGAKAAAPVFTAMAKQGNRQVPALMVFKEPWNDERARDGIGRFPNARFGLAVDIKVDEQRISWEGRLLELAGEGVTATETLTFAGEPGAVPQGLFAGLQVLAQKFQVTLDAADWQSAFGSTNPQAIVSFLVGLGNLSALQGRCIPASPDQLLTPLVDALNRDAGLDAAMQALHMMTDILVQNPVDQSAIPLALQALNVAAQRRKNDATPFHHLALLLRRLGDVGSSIQAFNQAFNIDPTNAQIATQFVETLRTAGDSDNARKVAEFAVERGCEAPGLFAQLGSLMIEADEFDAAEPFLRRAIEEGQVPSAYGDLANVLADRTAGTPEQNAEDRAESMQLLETAVGLPTVASSTLDMLLDLHEDQKLEQATLLLLRCAENHPEDATALRYVATMYLDGDDPAKARPWLERILELQRRTLDDDAFARRGRLQLDVENFDERYDDAIEQVRSGDAAAQGRASVFLREIIGRDASYWQPHLMLALAVRPAEGEGAALAHLMDAVRLRPNDAEIRTLIAAILRKQGRPREAVDHLRAAVTLQPRDIEPVLQLATCMRDANMFDEARQVAQAALQMLPNHPEFTRLLQSLPPPRTQQN